MKKFIVLLSVLGLSVMLSGCDDLAVDYSNNGDVGAVDVSSGAKQDDNLIKKTMRTEVQSGDVVAVMETSMGEIKMLLYTDKAPKTTNNFIELAKAGKYDDVPFHRVIKDFMIQGGDFENKNGTGGYTFEGPGTALKDEFGEGLKHIYGAVSMANAGPNTGGSQFFIVQNADGTPWLNGHHAVFGYVYDGMDVVEKIAAVDVDGMDRPLEDVLIKNVKIETIK